MVQDSPEETKVHLKVWKRIRCPECKRLIRMRFATDGTWILQDSKPSLFPPKEAELQNQVLDHFSEAQEIALEEIIRKVVSKMDQEHFFDQDKGEGEQ